MKTLYYMLVLVIFSSNVLAVTIFSNKNDFQIATQYYPSVTIDFEQFGDGTPIVGTPIINGGEWTNLGVTFATLDPSISGSVSLLEQASLAPSGTHMLFHSRPYYDYSSYVIDFVNPVIAFGMMVCDSEVGNNEQINVYNSRDELLASYPLPQYGNFVSDKRANFFWGCISQIAISKIVIIEEYGDEDMVPLDDVVFAVPEPATLLLLGVGGLVLRKR